MRKRYGGGQVQVPELADQRQKRINPFRKHRVEGNELVFNEFSNQVQKVRQELRKLVEGLIAESEEISNLAEIEVAATEKIAATAEEAYAVAERLKTIRFDDASHHPKTHPRAK